MTKTAIACVFAWLVPGAGHLFLNKWKRAAVFFVGVLLLFALGLYMEGKLFSLESGFFGFLRFFADAAIGLPYIIGKVLGWGQGDIRSLGYEYGNTFIYTAGLINMLLVLDAFDIAQGRKQ
ncbi:MAG: hypothetical protein JSU96_20785 [Acidobacteriota bacterium]|nr:MAG: hypothetical protein JSU96_20785 [Acidobacteriota bacterium]